MTERKVNIISGLIFTGLILGSGIMQTHLKIKPQIIMLILGTLTLSSFVFKLKTISTGLFYMFLAIMLYINYFMLTNFAIDILTPERIFKEGDEVLHPVANMSWVWGVIFGIILSPVTIILYHKKVSRNNFLEIGITALFLLTTSVIYIMYEIL